ncbi:uncharacterized protein ACRADG_008793 isoform 1-T3 [Cochliomyia hominivorax]
METEMMTNDTIMKSNCDNDNITDIRNSKSAFYISDEYINSSCGTIKTMAAATNDLRNNNETIKTENNGTQKQTKTESFTRDLSLMSNSSSSSSSGEEDSDSDNEGDKKSSNVSDCGEERDEEIFYDSTNESEDCERDGENDIKNKTTKEYLEEDCGLSKLYLNDIEIDSKEEEQTVTELVNAAEKDKIMKVEQNKSMRVAFGVILRLIFPLANGVVQGIKGIRDVRFLKVLRSIASSRHSLTNLFAFAANTISLNLSSVQVSHRIEPILKLLKIRKSRDGIESLPDSPTSPNGPEALSPISSPSATAPSFSSIPREPRYSLPNFQTSGKRVSLEESVAPNCCTLNILAEPPAGEPIRADIVFIHGLHGSLVNTWKQGLWENERRPVEFQRPPKPPVRPPKRPRHSRTCVVHPAHHKKRARFAHADVHHRHSHEKDSVDEAEENSYSFICGEPKDIQICDGIEYSFPTFRLRMHDNGRLLQAEHDTKLNNNHPSNSSSPSKEDLENSNGNEDQTKKVKFSKPSPNDPNFSKCWPGDWLPIDCPGVRVMALNYTTDPHLWRPLWKKKEPRSNLIQRSREMTELLIKHRVGYGHPIIWVGHSKGGLFIKQIIVDAWESGRPAAAPFWRSARGVFFYSVPHRGSHLASIKAPLLQRSVELIDIEKNNKYLLDLHRRFAGLYHLGHLKIEVFSFVETALTLMSVLYMRIVGVDSADPGIGDVCGIRLDHREICKPRSRDCILYKQLVNMINKVC